MQHHHTCGGSHGTQRPVRLLFPDSTEKYNTKPVDPTKARKPLLAGIEKAREQFNADQFRKPHRWFSVNNEVVAFHPKLDGRALILNGVEENHMPSDRFVEFLDLMEKEVNDGQFDEVIAAHGKGNVDVHIGKAPRKRGATGTEKPWTARTDWSSLSTADKQAVSSRYRFGKNPDNTVISEVGHKPDAPISADRRKV
ncbi:hypothetical protein MOP88_07395 [Sphingomonas sp. WKB10]|nr:hypothetical protein [Sphingomonas sp. WKB10]